MARSKKDTSLEFYEEPTNSIGYLARITFRAFSRNLERRTLPYGVSAGQWPFLRALWREEGMTQRELSKRAVMREPTTVTALNSLEKSGLVRRVPSKEDRRKVHVYLTPKGRRLKEKLLPFIAEVNAIASQGLRQSDVDELRRVLLSMSASFTKEER